MPRMHILNPVEREAFDSPPVSRVLNANSTLIVLPQYAARVASLRHQTSIRAFYSFRAFISDAPCRLLKNIASMVQSHVKPKVIFWRCIDLLVRERIEVPGYTRLMKVILGATNQRSHDLASILEDALTRDVRALLDQLLTQKPVEGTPGKTNAYKLTLMKKLSQSSKPSKVKERVVDWDVVRDLHYGVVPG